MHGAHDSGAVPRADPARGLWIMLLALTTGFALSQAYRTVAAIMATQLQREFGLTAQQLGVFAATFHFSFGALQLVMGIGIDLHGVRRTVLAAFPLTMAGALVSAFAPDYPMAVFGQALIGVGCAPAFLVCTVFIARRFPAAQFASVSGLVLGFGGVGLLITGTPLAWVVEVGSWRTGFLVLAAGSALAWLVIFALVREAAPPRTQPRAGVASALRDAAALIAMPHTAGIVALAAVTYASFIALRGLWLGPMLIDRYGFSLLQTGNVALAISVASLIGPPLFGRHDRVAATRRHRIVGFSLLLAALFALLALVHHAPLVVATTVVIGFLTGFIVWQYADVRAAYPESFTGRAMAVFTMAMFLGVAVVQWLSGLIASLAQARHADPYTAVLLSIAAMVALGALAFVLLPAPPPRH